MNKMIKKLIGFSVGFWAFIGFVQYGIAATPVLSINPSPSVTQTSATFSVFYDDMGDTLTSVSVRYGADPSMSSYVPDKIPNPGKGTLPFTANNLTPGTTYYFQAVGAASSQTVFSSRYTFTTQPVVTLPTNCSIDNFSASQNFLNQPGNVTLNWSTSNCNSVTISSVGSTSLSGSTSVFVSGTTTYVLTAQSGNTVTSSLTVTVNNNQNNNNQCEIDSFRADDTNVGRGDRVRLTWSTDNCNSVDLSSNGGVSLDGSTNVFPTRTTTYTLNAYGNNGSDRATVTVRVDDNNSNNNDDCEVDEFRADRYVINPGESVNLSWDSTDCDDANLSNYGNVDTEESRFRINPSFTTTYTLRMYGDNSTTTRSLTISVNQNNTVYNPPVVNYPQYPTTVSTTRYIVDNTSQNVSTESPFTDGGLTTRNNLSASAGSTGVGITFVGLLIIIALILLGFYVAKRIKESGEDHGSHDSHGGHH